MMNNKKCPFRQRLIAAALSVSLAAAGGAGAAEDQHGGRIQAYDRATGTLVVNGHKAHLGPATRLQGYRGERISGADLQPGMSVRYEVRPAGEGIPEIAVLELIPN